MQRALSYLLALGLLGLAPKLNTSPTLRWTDLIDISSILLLFLAAGLTFFSFRWQELRLGLKALASKKPASAYSLATGTQILTSLWKYQVFVLIFMWLLSLSMALFQNAPQDLNSTGHYVAILLISSVYLIFLKLLVIQPLQLNLARKQLLLKATQDL